MKIVMILEKTPVGWAAYTPEKGLCVNACANTREETIDLFVEALRFHLEGMQQEGQSFPKITGIEIHETLALPEALAA